MSPSQQTVLPPSSTYDLEAAGQVDKCKSSENSCVVNPSSLGKMILNTLMPRIVRTIMAVTTRKTPIQVTDILTFIYREIPKLSAALNFGMSKSAFYRKPLTTFGERISFKVKSGT